jgi:hypothetical protein
MPTLRAKFVLPVSAPCLLEWPDNALPETSVASGVFTVAVRLLSSGYGVKYAGPNFIRNLSTVELVISRNEQDAPPGAVMTDGKPDWSAQVAYLNQRSPAYRDVARETVNRLLTYFKYHLRTPMIELMGKWDQALHNAVWLDESGNPLYVNMLTIIAQPMPGAAGELGVKPLTPGDLPGLHNFLEAPNRAALVEELLSDAQSAWFEENLRRAVLELAICVEVMVKRKYFAKASPAGAAFDYLEDKAKISVRVLELLDAIAKEAFSRSYRVDAPAQYQRIDHLFRCRNKIAHRGELSFRDDAATLVTVDKGTVESWWRATDHLMAWLNALP